ncbi:uncharacterized protein LOC144379724 isoform X2 [Halichoerus grypus]
MHRLALPTGQAEARLRPPRFRLDRNRKFSLPLREAVQPKRNLNSLSDGSTQRCRLPLSTQLSESLSCDLLSGFPNILEVLGELEWWPVALYGLQWQMEPELKRLVSAGPDNSRL